MAIQTVKVVVLADECVQPNEVTAQKTIGLFDGVVFVLSCTVGSGLFFAPTEVAKACHDPMLAIIAWVIGGCLTIAGSLIYSELGTSLVSAGAESFYLKKAVGPWASFTFTWVMVTIVGSTACACIADVMGGYVLGTFLDVPDELHKIYAAIVIILFLFAVNTANPNYVLILNRFNVACKVLAVMSVVFGASVAVMAGRNSPAAYIQEPWLGPNADWTGLPSAIMFVCFALCGWNLLNPMSEEMVNPEKDMPKAYALGMLSTLGLALLVNIAFFAVIPYHSMVTSGTLAGAFITELIPGDKIVKPILCVMISFCCLGSCNGIMMGTSRCIASNGVDGVLPQCFGYKTKKHQVPFIALLFFTTWTIIQLLALTISPKRAIEIAVGVYSVAQWSIFFMIGVSLFILRYKFPLLHRPYKVHLYPILPLFFIAMSAVIVVMVFKDDRVVGLVSTLFIIMGPIIYMASKCEPCRRSYNWIIDLFCSCRSDCECHSESQEDTAGCTLPIEVSALKALTPCQL